MQINNSSALKLFEKTQSYKSIGSINEDEEAFYDISKELDRMIQIENEEELKIKNKEKIDENLCYAKIDFSKENSFELELNTFQIWSDKKGKRDNSQDFSKKFQKIKSKSEKIKSAQSGGIFTNFPRKNLMSKFMESQKTISKNINNIKPFNVNFKSAENIRALESIELEKIKNFNSQNYIRNGSGNNFNGMNTNYNFNEVNNNLLRKSLGYISPTEKSPNSRLSPDSNTTAQTEITNSIYNFNDTLNSEFNNFNNFSQTDSPNLFCNNNTLRTSLLEKEEKIIVNNNNFNGSNLNMCKDYSDKGIKLNNNNYFNNINNSNNTNNSNNYNLINSNNINNINSNINNNNYNLTGKSIYNNYQFENNQFDLNLNSINSLNSPNANLYYLKSEYNNNLRNISSPSPLNYKNPFDCLKDKNNSQKGKKHMDDIANKIDLENILRGRDKRTTLMIRHIPNKYNLYTMLEDINQEFKDKFDVFYLPLDYVNNCNLGFAFINFVDPLHLLLFYETFRAKKWRRFNSEKICELAYAKFQGKKELIAHFEKGSVMNFESEEKKPLILPTPNPLPNIEIPLKFFEAFIVIYPYASVEILKAKFVVYSLYGF